MKKILILILFFLPLSCAAIPSEALFKERLEEFMHRPEAYLVMNMGAPNSSYDAGAEYKVLTYSKTSREHWGAINPGIYYNLDCQINFTVSKKSGNVITYTYKGNNCVAYGGLKGVLN
jgi:hypothetical protein